MKVENREFRRILRLMRRVLPAVSWLTWGGVYFVSGLLHSSLIFSLLGDIPNRGLIAFGMGFSIQLSRAIIIFFRQNNPTTPDFSATGEIVAFVFGFISIGEIIYLINAGTINPALGITAAVLMGAGVLVEIMLYRQIKLASELELHENPEAWDAIKDFYMNRKRLRDFLYKLEDQEFEEPEFIDFKKPEIEVPTLSPVKTEPDLNIEDFTKRLKVERTRAKAAGFSNDVIDKYTNEILREVDTGNLVRAEHILNFIQASIDNEMARKSERNGHLDLT